MVAIYFENSYNGQPCCIDATKELLNYGYARLISHSYLTTHCRVIAANDPNLERHSIYFKLSEQDIHEEAYTSYNTLRVFLKIRRETIKKEGSKRENGFRVYYIRDVEQIMGSSGTLPIASAGIRKVFCL